MTPTVPQIVLLTAAGLGFVIGASSCWLFARLYVRAKINQSKRREKVWERIAKSATDDPIRWSLMMDRTNRELMR